MQEVTHWLTRFYFQRALGLIYLFAFTIAYNQFKGLCGENGILPVRTFLKHTTKLRSLSLFWFNPTDRFATLLSTFGIALSLFALSGFSEAFGPWVSILTWFSLLVSYASFVNVGQEFYAFGWELLLIETGFLAIFLGDAKSAPPILVIYLLKWVLFRLMFGAGLIKIRGDQCWRDLTALQYHYETMPMPGPTSRWFALLPNGFHKLCVLFNHLVELIVPFFYLATTGLCVPAGIITIIFQASLIISGNFSWLNHLTVVLALACLDDSFLSKFLNILNPWAHATGVPADSAQLLNPALPITVYYILTAGILLLSIRPVVNMLSRSQIMNTSFDPFHLVNSYGAFGSITRIRHEIILEAGNSEQGPWTELEFKGKPGDVKRTPPFVSPYHFKLDWQMWFAAMSPYYDHSWILGLITRLLQGKAEVRNLLRTPSGQFSTPKFIRVIRYRYRYANPKDKRVWIRSDPEEYLPPLSLDHPGLLRYNQEQGIEA